jgi:hypothetical protein
VDACPVTRLPLVMKGSPFESGRRIKIPAQSYFWEQLGTFTRTEGVLGVDDPFDVAAELQPQPEVLLHGGLGRSATITRDRPRGSGSALRPLDTAENEPAWGKMFGHLSGLRHQRRRAAGDRQRGGEPRPMASTRR